jgi:hypothetical protein
MKYRKMSTNCAAFFSKTVAARLASRLRPSLKSGMSRVFRPLRAQKSASSKNAYPGAVPCAGSRNFHSMPVGVFVFVIRMPRLTPAFPAPRRDRRPPRRTPDGGDRRPRQAGADAVEGLVPDLGLALLEVLHDERAAALQVEFRDLGKVDRRAGEGFEQELVVAAQVAFDVAELLDLRAGDQGRVLAAEQFARLLDAAPLQVPVDLLEQGGHLFRGVRHGHEGAGRRRGWSHGRKSRGHGGQGRGSAGRSGRRRDRRRLPRGDDPRHVGERAAGVRHRPEEARHEGEQDDEKELPLEAERTSIHAHHEAPIVSAKAPGDPRPPRRLHTVFDAKSLPEFPTH